MGTVRRFLAARLTPRIGVDDLALPLDMIMAVTPRSGGYGHGHQVEVAGIEPASFVASTGLLRAQCALSLLDPTGLAHEPV